MRTQIHPCEPKLSELYSIRSGLYNEIALGKTKELSRKMHAITVQINRHEAVRYAKVI